MGKIEECQQVVFPWLLQGLHESSMHLTSLTHNAWSEASRLRKSRDKSREAAGGTGVSEAKHINLWKMPDCIQLYCHDLLIYPPER